MGKKTKVVLIILSVILLLVVGVFISLTIKEDTIKDETIKGKTIKGKTIKNNGQDMVESAKKAVFYSNMSFIEETLSIYIMNYKQQHKESPTIIKEGEGIEYITIEGTNFYPLADNITKELLQINDEVNISLEDFYVSKDGELIYKTGVKLKNGDVMYNRNITIKSGEKAPTVPILISEYK